MIKDGQTRRSAMGALVSTLTVPHLASELARSQAADALAPHDIFIDATVAAATMAGEASVAIGSTFKAFGTQEGYVEVRSRTADGSDLLYAEITKAALLTPSGDSLVGSDDQQGGLLWNNVAGFVSYLRSSIGARIIGFVQAGLGACHRNVLEKLCERKSVMDFGAIGDGVLHPVSEWIVPGTRARFASLEALQVEYPHVTSISQSIDWAAFQAASDFAKKVGALIHVPCGHYRINDTVNTLNSPSEMARSFGFRGENGNSTRLYFDNLSKGKNFFEIGPEISYMMFCDLEFVDAAPGTSRCFYFSDTRDGNVPAWKHLFQNVRVSSFWEGARFDGAATNDQDAYQSEVMFLHSKFRNCHKSIIYNNIQAVNHQLIGLDIENDQTGDSTEQWPGIIMERGSVINWTGGSFIGYGSLLRFKYAVANDFQNTSQFAARNVRVEKKPGSAPLIDHDPLSNITLSNSLRVVMRDMPVQAGEIAGHNPIFARVGGRVYLQLDNVHANRTMTINAYMTKNLRDSGLYGFIQGPNCKNLSYRRIADKIAYGSTEALASNQLHAIPAELSFRVEGKQWDDNRGFLRLRSTRQTIQSGGPQIVQSGFSWASETTSGIGTGLDPSTTLFQLPVGARPCQFRIHRDNYSPNSPFKFDLYAVVFGEDYLAASITPTEGRLGHFAADIQIGSVLSSFVVDDVGWDGKMKFVKSGTVDGFVGTFFVDF